MENNKRIFKSANEFSLYIEELKDVNSYDTYIDTILEFYESESDLEFSQISKLINRTLREKIELEAIELNKIKGDNNVSLERFL